MATATKQFDQLPDCISGSFQLEEAVPLVFGGQLTNVIAHYSIYGNPNNPAIVVLGGISADRYVADTNIEGLFAKGWWDPLVGYNKAIDLAQYCVIAFDYFDGQSGSLTGISNNELRVSTFDQAFLLKAILDELQIQSLKCIVGSSYGGMVGLAFAQNYPDKVEQLIAICSTEESGSKNTGFRYLQRQILSFSLEHDDVQQGLILARALATLGYRGEQEIESRFKNQICINKQQANFPVVSYLKSQGDKFADRFCARRFINLSLSVDLHKIEPNQITIPTLCIGIEGDLIAPPQKVKQLADRIGLNAHFKKIESKVGHDGFLKEFEQLTHLIQIRLEH